MSLRDLQKISTTVETFVVLEEDVSGGYSSAQLALALGLAELATGTTTSTAQNPKLYRVLGYDPKRLWCRSNIFVALDDSTPFPDYPGQTNCPEIKGIKIVRLDPSKPLPCAVLDYYGSLLSFSETDGGGLELYDKPTLDAKLQSLTFDGTVWHATVWIEGSYKGKHKSFTVDFSYNAAENKVCAGFPNQKNDYIRVEDIQVCWYLDRDVICADATVIWRPDPHIVAHVEACVPVSFARSLPTPHVPCCEAGGGKG